MAHELKKTAHNTPGEFYVDSTCINCKTCNHLAPSLFHNTGWTSYVAHQPETSEAFRLAAHALLACPTGSIGTLHPHSFSNFQKEFPLLIAPPVFYCGFNSPKSYGGHSYFIQSEQGNWLVDSPRYLPQLVRQFELLGGLHYIFLTHQDDVADAALYARYFSAQRIIHQFDQTAQRDADILILDDKPIEFKPGFQIIPTPGHTRGHCVLLYQNQFLFTGDHFWWNAEHHRLEASSAVAWYSWEKQIESIQRLVAWDFEWILPGHGQRLHLPSPSLHQAMEKFSQTLASQLP
jgi:glyoxylase-like metal-dependent hydrolase (beta-lactamase superfamily II)/ferredoxin